jgi:hypothetical protein
MKFTISCSLVGPSLVLALALAGTSAAAQDQQASGIRVRPFVSLGVLGGGDKLSSVDVRIGNTTTTESVRAGGSVDVRGGVEFTFDPQWSLQLSAGYVTDGVRAENGKVTFVAYPVEALGHFKVHPAWRIGAGLRAPLSAKYDEGGVAGNTDIGFSAKVAPVIEVEWLVIPSVGIKLRGMHETYKVKGSSVKVDGNSVGLSGSYYFF